MIHMDHVIDIGSRKAGNSGTAAWARDIERALTFIVELITAALVARHALRRS